MVATAVSVMSSWLIMLQEQIYSTIIKDFNSSSCITVKQFIQD